MSGDGKANSSNDDALARKAIIEEFERAWELGDSPQIETFLSRGSTDDSELLFELVHVDLELRFKSGECVDFEDYVTRFPQLKQSSALLNEFERTATDLQRRNPNVRTRERQADTVRALPQPAMGEGERFGDYELIDEIARGGMGVVYKAQHLPLNRTVALKMILAGELAGEEEVHRFQVEATSAAGLDHPGIVPVYETGEHEGRQFLSMGLVEGESLRDRIRETVFSPREAAQLVKLVSEAVDYAHGKGVIHRDLKPSNILLDSTGAPRITDFGLAKQVDANSDLTATGQTMGTPAYMPPEQAIGDREAIGAAADIYALGAVLYECVTGRPPFVAATPWETHQQVISNEPVGPRSLNPAIDRDLETICLKCLEKTPERRYRSAARLVDELDRFLKGQPIAARPVGRIIRAWRWCRRNPVVASLSIASVVLLMATIAVGAAGLIATSIQRDTLRRNLYAAEVGLAYEALELGGANRLRGLLDKWAPTGDADDQAGWEWHFVRSQSQRETARLTGHTETIDSVAWDHAGERIASASGDGVIIVWRVDSPTDSIKIIAHELGLTAVDWAPDDSEIASGGSDGLVKLWDADSGDLIKTLDIGVPVYSVRWNRDGWRIAVAAKDGKARIWDAKTNKVTLTLEGHSNVCWDAVWHPKLDRIASAGDDQRILIWDVANGERLAETMTNYQHWRVAWDPSGSRIVTASQPNSVVVWDGDTLDQLHVFRGHQSIIRTVDWSVNGARIASGSQDRTIRIWDASRIGKRIAAEDEIEKIVGHTDEVIAVSWRPQGGFLASAGRDKSVRVWDVANVRSDVVFQGKSPATAADWHPDGRIGVADMQGAITVTDPEAVLSAKSWKAHHSYIHEIRWSPDGQFIASAGNDRTTKVWRADTHELLFERENPDGHVTQSVAWSPSGDRIAHTIGTDLAICEATAGKALHKIGGMETTLMSIAWKPNGELIVGGDERGMVAVFSTQSGERSTTFQAHEDRVRAVAWSPDGRYVATAAHDQTVKVWDSEDWSLKWSLHGHIFWVIGLGWHPVEPRLASSGGDGLVKIWDTETGNQLLTLQAHDGRVRAVRWDAEGYRLATVGFDGKLKSWDASRSYAQFPK